MRRFLTAVALAASLTLVGCDPGRSVLQGGGSLTASINNPVGLNELAAVESVYNVAANAALVYRGRPLCTRAALESPTNLCARRSFIVRIQAADQKAYAAIRTARAFVTNNPTLSAVSAIGAARAAVTSFQNALADSGVRT